VITERWQTIHTGIAEDKHAAAEDLMLRLSDVKRLYGRKVCVCGVGGWWAVCAAGVMSSSRMIPSSLALCRK
jgi:tRNA A37 threonylcarbamoyladenosine dehydratase